MWKHYDVFNLIMFRSFLYVCIVASGAVCGLALSGGGALYVHYHNDSVHRVSVVDKENGRVVRTLDTSKLDTDSFQIIHSHENVLLLVEWYFGPNTYKCVHVYENEVYKRTLQLLIKNNVIRISTVLCGRDFLLLLTDKSTLAIVDLNQSGSKAKFKSIRLGQVTDNFSLLWIERGDEQSGEGYLFASESKEKAFNSHVYELNVKSVVDGALLTPLQIPFMNSYGYRNIFFTCTMGTDAILCSDVCGTKMNEDEHYCPASILKLEKIH